MGIITAHHYLKIFHLNLQLPMRENDHDEQTFFLRGQHLHTIGFTTRAYIEDATCTTGWFSDYPSGKPRMSQVK